MQLYFCLVLQVPTVVRVLAVSLYDSYIFG